MATLDFDSLVDYFSGKKKQQPIPSAAQPPSRWPLLDEIYGKAPEVSAAPTPPQAPAQPQQQPQQLPNPGQAADDVNEFFKKHFNLIPRNRLKEAGLE